MAMTRRRLRAAWTTGLRCALGLIALSVNYPARAQDVLDAHIAEARQVGALLLQQADDWNRGDLEAFARGYKDAPDILFMGPTIQKGYTAMLAGYRKRYPTREKMGTLTFTSLAVQPLDENFATATGQFLLKRTEVGGGPAAGYFLLVLERTGAGWKIVRDDTTGTLPKPACAPAAKR